MIKSITSVKVSGRRVVVRAGFDVPLEKNSKTGNWDVADETRIKDALPTIKHLLTQKAKVVIISHLGRPEGWDKEKSLLPAAIKLGEMLCMQTVEVTDSLSGHNSARVYFVTSDITQKDYSLLTHDMKDGDILFLENMRFYKGEETNDQKFINTIASFGDLYVNEAFSVAHRKESSTYGIAEKLPAYAGLGFLKEIEILSRLIRTPHAPFIFMFGGAKAEDKIQVIEFLSQQVAHFLIGGASANAFLAAKGFEVGKSKVSGIEAARQVLRNLGHKIILPVDVVVAKDEQGQAQHKRITEIQPDDMIYDIGPETIRNYSKYIKSASTLVWNGPFGLFENPKFAAGSRALAQIFAARSKGQAFGVVGGGETVELFDQTKSSNFVDHISTGGGAMLEFLAGKKLPAIKVLENQ
jgi:phosphoglycerate kinase